ncbi:MAG TPA: GAF domain-containing sensor histidine kinase [Chitinispirillaceae bacterium]|nr:GAF domain-containing sensor histidine kinase [Chitinispirillaceae bacterium]
MMETYSSVLLIALLGLLLLYLYRHITVRDMHNYRYKTLESIYSIVTASGVSNHYNQIVSGIASVLNVPYVSISKVVDGDLVMAARYKKVEKTCRCGDTLCRRVLESGKPVQSVLQSHEGECEEGFGGGRCLGVPVKGSRGDVEGVICVFSSGVKAFSRSQVNTVEMFGAYAANRDEREVMLRKKIRREERRFLSRFVSGVVHEVRNPLNAIIAISEALFEELKENGVGLTVYRDHIKGQVDKLSGLMKDVLDFGETSLQQSGRVFSLGGLCKDAIVLWKEINVDKETVLSVDIQENGRAAMIRGDEERLRKMIMYLLDNASQHSAPDGEIVFRMRGNSRGTHVIQVIDKGCGIPAENAGRIFEPFFSTVKRTGLGLCKVNNTVEDHGGVIHVCNNAPLPGVTVQVTLPALPEFSEPANGCDFREIVNEGTCMQGSLGNADRVI